MRKLTLVVLAIAVILLGNSVAAFAAPPTPPGVSTARSQLAALTVSTGDSMTGYSRDKFPHWITESDGCTSREEVLKRDGTGVTVDSDCYPTAGSWHIAYDGTTVTVPSKVQIDHIVPLADAWRSGADKWTTDQRKAFANDLTDPQLIASSAQQNESKGDSDPSEWKPALQSYWCLYARDWIDDKTVWKLTITSDEKTALSSMLDTC
jgi:uncharacterized protein DUF1524